MAKEFGQWIADMSNSIEDASEFHRELDIAKATTPLQKKVLIADILVPKVHCLNDLSDWLAALCITMRGDSGRKSPAEDFISSILGMELAKEWGTVLDDTDAIIFKVKIRKLIADGYKLGD